ncbi:MAG: SUMF1/EgtB/PvdO family nonheme iron enzyme [Isosphaeraceae bacterium]
MSDHDGGEYDLVDLPEDPGPRPNAAQNPGAGPVKPLPRLWRTDQDEEQPEDQLARKADAEPVKAPAEPPRPSRPRPRSKPSVKEGGEKKALIEETPALDTYEARQRGRLMLGILIPACLGIFGYIFYQLFIYDPYGFEVNDAEPPVAAAPVAPRRDLDAEARSLLDRAREQAKAGRTEEAIKMLTLLAKSYPSTGTATEAKEALERPKQNLPLFLDRPTVQAEDAPKPEPTAPPPPQVVEARPRPTQGNASLTLPANPAELTPSNASPLAMSTAPDVPTPSPPPARPLPPGFRARRDAGVHHSGWPLVIVGDRDGAPMMLVPGGTFSLGNDAGPTNEAPAHKARLSAYYIDQHEVTVRQFRLFLAESHHRGQPPRSWSEELQKVASESMPMVMVNARDAQAYAEWALKGLPTEAQWEAAARSTDGRLYPWGAEPTGSDRPRDASTRIDPAGSHPKDASPYGVLDLGGNVLEWTRDWYDSRYYRSLALDVVDNPTGSATKPRSLEVVVKGDRKTGSAATRQGINLEKRLTYVGFRCVLPVTEHPVVVSPSPTVPTAPAVQPQPPAQPAAPAPEPTAVPF